MERSPKEIRFVELSLFDQTVHRKGYKVIAGVDEAGRGPLAGPVVAAACILPSKNSFIGVDDSKKLTSIQRHNLFEQLVSDKKVVFGVGVVSAQEIDAINIYQATLQAMLKALAALTIDPDILLVDGMPLAYKNVPSEKVLQGDGRSLSIAAASIIAKVTRDRMMAEFHASWPDYGFDQHKGYGTPKHLNALKKLGPCPIHRRSFSGVL
jgi:ribonuclease HII